MNDAIKWSQPIASIKCPKCGSTLLLNQRGEVWCSFIGGRKEPSCAYKGRIKIEERNDT